MIIPGHVYQSFLNDCGGTNVVRSLKKSLPDLWADDYFDQFATSELTTVSLGQHSSKLSYLFDIERGRVVAAYGVPVYVEEERDGSRQKGHPFYAKQNKKRDKRYIKGHLMAHSLGGGMDINVIPQLAKVNGGEFRKLEIKAAALANKGVRPLYFVHCSYADGVSQRPSAIEQALIEPPHGLFYSQESNL